MKDLIRLLHKAFDNRTRLGIMSILVVNDWTDYLTLRTMLDETDGNLASHLANLERSEFIEIKKEFVGKKTKTSYRVTALGRQAFNDHLDALEAILKQRT